jgi:hypothetical protein
MHVLPFYPDLHSKNVSGVDPKPPPHNAQSIHFGGAEGEASVAS